MWIYNAEKLTSRVFLCFSHVRTTVSPKSRRWLKGCIQNVNNKHNTRTINIKFLIISHSILLIELIKYSCICFASIYFAITSLLHATNDFNIDSELLKKLQNTIRTFHHLMPVTNLITVCVHYFWEYSEGY